MNMLTLTTRIVAHKGDATETLLREYLRSEDAVADREIRVLFNHILVANRFWSALIRGVAFDVEHEVQADRAPAELPAAFREVQADELAWLAAASEADLAREVTQPMIPGGTCSIAEAFAQVCLHTHGHRAQIMKMLRRHGIAPSAHDFILWLAAQGK